MGVLATITISGTAYTVYGLTTDPVGDANRYFSVRLGAEGWNGTGTAVPTLKKQQGLITAFRWIERLKWKGTKTVLGQATQFPRDGLVCGDVIYPPNSIPDTFVQGEFELALALMTNPAIQTQTGTGSNLQSAKAGTAEVTFFAPTIGTELDMIMPLVPLQLFSCFILSGSFNAGGFASGTDGRSAFTDCRRNDLMRGYP